MNKLNYRFVVNSGQLLLIEKSVSDSQVEDVVNSLLYAQLAADNRAPKFDDGSQWLTTQLDAQTSFGWNFPVVSDELDVVKAGKFSVPTLIAQGLPSLVDQAARDGFCLRLGRLARNTRGMQVLTASTCQEGASGKLAQVMCTVVIVSAGPQLEYACVRFYTTQTPVPDVWSCQFERARVIGKVSLTTRIGRLQEMLYGPIREELEVELKDERPTHVFVMDEP